MNEIKKNGLDYKIVIILVVYAVIIGMFWGISQSNINDNSDDIYDNEKHIKTNTDVNVVNQLNINTLSVQMDNMIDLQKEMNKTLKELK